MQLFSTTSYFFKFILIRERKENIMKKVWMLMIVIMLLAVVTAIQAEVRPGGLPALSVDDGIKDNVTMAQADVRPGGLPPLNENERIPSCNCKTDSSSCPQPAAEPAMVSEPAPVVAPPPAPRPAIIEKGRQTLDVEFDFNKSIIKQGYYKDIDDLANVMKDYPDLKVVIEGHTDNIGTAAYNKKLSQRRAEAVKQYLVEKGINANRIAAEGFGFDRPIASNDTDEGRQKNRRVEAAVDYVIQK
jgi:OOP family OmpA-OmpF porin